MKSSQSFEKDRSFLRFLEETKLKESHANIIFYYKQNVLKNQWTKRTSQSWGSFCQRKSRKE